MGMKNFTKKICAFLALVCMVMVMASCSEEKTEPSMPAAKMVEGSYVGNLTYKVLETNYEEKGLTYKVEAVSDNEINLVISTFGNPPMQIPEVKVKTTVAGKDGEFVIPESVVEGVLEGGKKFTVTLRGSIKGKEAAIDFSLTYGNMPFPIICSFKGSK